MRLKTCKNYIEVTINVKKQKFKFFTLTEEEAYNIVKEMFK